MSERLHKYPRTPHIQGSHIMPGDEDLPMVPLSAIAGRHLVLEEKMDGANVGISFGADCSLRLQSRGHFLTGGPREQQFTLFKQWAYRHAPVFQVVLGSRYIVYGEWLYAKHTLFYDALPHYFLEFDVLDTENDKFLSTDRRRELLAPLPLIGVPVLHAGPLKSHEHLEGLLGPSAFATDQCASAIQRVLQDMNLSQKQDWAHADTSGFMEGIYI